MAIYISGDIESFNTAVNRSADLFYLSGSNRWQASIKANLNTVNIFTDDSSGVIPGVSNSIYLLFYEDDRYLNRFYLGLLQDSIYVRLPIRDYQRTIELFRTEQSLTLEIILQRQFSRFRVMSWTVKN